MRGISDYQRLGSSKSAKMIVWLLSWGFLSFAMEARSQSGIGKRPNIVYIYADDLGFGELGCYGQTKIKTPNLDRLAAEGIRFTRHYSGAPVCAPSRTMLMTGLHAGHSPIRMNEERGGFEDHNERGQKPLPAGVFTLPGMLKKAGYATGMVGKWGLGMHDTEGDPLKHGFDYYYGYLDQKQAHNHYPSHLWENGRWDTLGQPFFLVHKRIDSARLFGNDFADVKGVEYAPYLMTEKALDFLDRNRDRPFFLYLPYAIPHVSLQAPDEAIARYVGRFEEKPYLGEGGYTPSRYPLSTYAAMITLLDEQVGRILDRLKTLGLDGNTIVMFSSDNGPTYAGGVRPEFFNSTGGLRGLKGDLYEGGIRVPFIVRWPGVVSPGRTSGHVSAQYDLSATVAEILGQPAPASDGLSFLPELMGSKQRTHDYLYFEFFEKNGQKAVMMGDWKAVKSNLKKDPGARWELYHLGKDPGETKDLSTGQRRMVRRADRAIREVKATDPSGSVRTPSRP
jgi:arylsulfatase A